ncbi:cytochrome P450 [Mariannaea sp. PMI_226]|nr:cytochrome P450 [Mariannaea sp. PMI_226]
MYNILFHPLRKYPGPMLFAASRLPMLYHLQSGDMHDLMMRLHEKYGPVVRTGPNELSFVESRAWKDIYAYRGVGGETFRRDHLISGPDLNDFEKGLLRADNEDHARQRRIFSHAFSNFALTQQESLICSYVNSLIQRLQDHHNTSSDEPLDIVPLYNFTSFDIMADLTFGESLGMLKNGEYVPWASGVNKELKGLAISMIFRTYPLLNYFATWLQPKSLAEKRKQHINYSMQRVDRRLERDDDRADIWSLIFRQGEVNMTKWEMYSNARTFMSAGTETVATLLSGVTYLLLKHPVKLERLVREIRKFKCPTDLNISTLQQCQYLNACLKEALRFYPPVPNALKRITPPGGAHVCGGFVPEKKTRVGIPFYASLRSHRNFTNPSEYVPERWLSEAPDAYLEDNKASWQPFSFGPRNCLGMNLAWHEMRLILSSCLWHFDLTLAETDVNWLDQKSYIVWAKMPLFVSLCPAERNSQEGR